VVKSGLTYSPGPAYTGDPEPGWNLLGNPFASAIKWSTGWSLPLNVAAIAKIMVGAGGGYTDINADGIIPATQGFMVMVTSGTASITIPHAAQTHSTIPWYKATGNPYIKLMAHNPGAQTFQESVLTFDNQATPGYDPAYDSRFLPGYAPLFYSVDGSEHLSTNALPELHSTTVVPFDFIKTAGSNFYIEAAQLENFPSQVYLTDLKLNQTQELTANPVYNFTSTDGDNPARFVLSFGPMTGTGGKTVGNSGIYTFENNLYLVNPGKAKFEVYSLTGQKLQAQEVDSPGLFKTTLYLPTAYYVVRLTTGTKVVVTKVFIKS
jgi:hypothetical protein